MKKKLAPNNFEAPEHLSKEFELPACNQHFLGDLKILKIWTFEIPAPQANAKNAT